MTDRISKVQRWLDLISFLVGRRFPVDVDEVMHNVPAYARRWAEGSDTDRDSVRRMFERDKDELRDLGVPLESVKYSINFGMEQVEGYRLSRKEFFLPYLRLLEEEEDDVEDADAGREPEGREPGSELAGSVFEIHEEEASTALDALDHVLDRDAFPLREEARAARRKLTFDLDPDALDRTPVLWIDPPGAAERRELLDALSEALLRRKSVRFRYHGIARDEVTEREVEPWGLFFQHAHWYLVGRDRDRDARRIFRLGRMAALDVNQRSPASADFRVPEGFDLDELRDRDPWDLGDEEPVEARVRFAFPRSLWAERNGMGELVRREDDGAQVRAFRVVQADPFLRWILSLAGEAEIVDPPELVDAFGEMGRQVAALYRGDSGTNEESGSTGHPNG